MNGLCCPAFDGYQFSVHVVVAIVMSDGLPCSWDYALAARMPRMRCAILILDMFCHVPDGFAGFVP